MASGNTSKPTHKGHLKGDGRRRGRTGPQGGQATRRQTQEQVCDQSNREHYSNGRGSIQNKT